MTHANNINQAYPSATGWTILIWAAGQDEWNQFGKVGEFSPFLLERRVPTTYGQDDARMLRIIMNRRMLPQDDPRMIPDGAVSGRDLSKNANCSAAAAKAQHIFLQPSLRTLPDTQNQQNESAVAHQS